MIDEHIYNEVDMVQVGDSKVEKDLGVIWYDKLELAVEQLSDAIRLFFKKRYISSITLAGASDEILGGILKGNNKKSSLQTEIESFENAFISIDSENSPAAKDWYLFEKNYIRNHLKHYSLSIEKRKGILSLLPDLKDEIGRSTHIPIYPQEAISVIQRGIENYLILGKSFKKLDCLINKFHEKVDS